MNKNKIPGPIMEELEWKSFDTGIPIDRIIEIYLSRKDSHLRDVGTDTSVEIFKQDTPGQETNRTLSIIKKTIKNRYEHGNIYENVNNDTPGEKGAKTLRMARILAKGKGTGSITSDEYTKIRKIHREGHSTHTIAKELGSRFSGSALKHHMKKLGVTLSTGDNVKRAHKGDTTSLPKSQYSRNFSNYKPKEIK